MKKELYFLAFLVTSISSSSCNSDDIEELSPNQKYKKEVSNYLNLRIKDSIELNSNQNKESVSIGDPLNPRPPR